MRMFTSDMGLGLFHSLREDEFASGRSNNLDVTSDAKENIPVRM